MNNMGAPLCATCSRRVATHVCQNCGRAVCGNCIDPVRWFCTECQARLAPSAPREYSTQSPFSMPTLLFFVAFIVIFVGMLLMAFGSLSNLGNVSGGAVILIGPIPIILGSGPYSVALIALAAVLTIGAFVFFFILRRRA